MSRGAKGFEAVREVSAFARRFDLHPPPEFDVTAAAASPADYAWEVVVPNHIAVVSCRAPAPPRGPFAPDPPLASSRAR